MEESAPSSAIARILVFKAEPWQNPWAERELEPPLGFEVECHSLLELHEWRDEKSHSPVAWILVDLDSVSRTEPLDPWALQAWKASFNDLILKAMNWNGQPPVLVGFAREKKWEKARLGVRLGVRDLLMSSELEEFRWDPQQVDIASPQPRVPQNESTESRRPARESGSSTVIALFPKSSEDASVQSTLERIEKSAPLPKHVIPFPIEGLDGSSPAIEGIRSLIRKSAPLDTPVLILGATGSGKERVARAIHRYSQRAPGPFVSINCGAIAPSLIESELFGHVKGAFTGAHVDKVGLLTAANGGTLFLDEITELSLESQVKVLRALQEKEITPVGSNEPHPLDVRIISASKDDLLELVRTGKFRQDLYYRIKVIEIQLPALIERKQDIPDLSKTLLKRIAKRYKRAVPELSEAVIEKFLLHNWPGNIREFENVLEHAATLSWGENRSLIELQDLPDEIRLASMSLPSAQHLKEVVRRFEREYIASTVRRLGGSKEHAADALGLSLATLYRKLGS